MIKTVLQKALTQRQQDAGLFLVEPDDHTLNYEMKMGSC